MSKTVLITGASKGIGWALSQQFASNGYKVIGTSRSKTENTNSNIEMHQLDLADSASINKFSKTLADNDIVIDWLINNAAIGPDLGTNTPNENTMRATFEANVIGTVLFTESILNRIAYHGKIINISSKMGSIAVCSGIDSVAYRMSKTALNMYSKILTNRLKEEKKIATVHPGWVRTTLTEGNKNAPLSTNESATKLFEFIKSDFKTGIYWNAPEGKEIEW
jgi:short-subunit dehydrogenase